MESSNLSDAPDDQAALTPGISAVDEDEAARDEATVQLQSSLTDLAGLVSHAFSLEELLGKVATFAVNAIPGAQGAGVTLLRTGHPHTRVEALAASHPFVADIDELQYATLGEGPCITAALEQRTVRSGSLGGDKQWPRFGPRVGRLGVHSVLSLPLLQPDEVVGAINVYAREKDAFDDSAVHMGEQFAVPAAVAVHNAQVLAHAVALAAQLQTALASRPVIDQAIGILRSRHGETADQAFARLRTLSQHEHRKLVDVAEALVEQAAARARARRS
ncbi:MAG: GAF and ANTAR domain-containing protein [Dermatophilaceae bacterium]